MNTKDALGLPIVIGNLYGHSTRASGNVEVIIGKAELLEEGKVRLTEVKRGRALYEDNIHQTEQKRKVVTVTSNSVFPVSDDVAWDGLLEEK